MTTWSTTTPSAAAPRRPPPAWGIAPGTCVASVPAASIGLARNTGPCLHLQCFWCPRRPAPRTPGRRPSRLAHHHRCQKAHTSATFSPRARRGLRLGSQADPPRQSPRPLWACTPQQHRHLSGRPPIPGQASSRSRSCVCLAAPSCQCPACLSIGSSRPSWYYRFCF